MNERRALVYVQHLLGIGHLRRAATLCRAMAAAGLRTILVTGGAPLQGLDPGGAELIQLPPTRATDLRFKVLVDGQDRPIDEAWKANRRDHLLAVFRSFRPHLLITELFPFGRRQMRFELLPLLEAATATAERPLIVSSVRDILVAQQKSAREQEMLDLARRYFDRILVHGDPKLIPFERTFPLASGLADRLCYTGYVVEACCGEATDPCGAGEVIVSAGGGAVGERLLATALAARPQTRLGSVTWRVLVGVSVPEPRFRALAAAAGPGVVVERARPDFPLLLRNCRLSISQGGYNTVIEVLQAGCHAVAVPYAGGSETEQTLRVRLLAERGLLHVLEEERLAPESLAAMVDAAASGPPPALRDLDLSGAETSAALLCSWARTIPW